MDRSIFHENFNFTNFNREKFKKFLDEYPDITLERRFEREAWFILSSQNPDVSVKKAAAEFGLEELRSYIRRSGKAINPLWM
jgi:hypothetical protein